MKPARKEKRKLQIDGSDRHGQRSTALHQSFFCSRANQSSEPCRNSSTSELCTEPLSTLFTSTPQLASCFLSRAQTPVHAEEAFGQSNHPGILGCHTMSISKKQGTHCAQPCVSILLCTHQLLFRPIPVPVSPISPVLPLPNRGAAPPRGRPLPPSAPPAHPRRSPGPAAP